MKDNSKDIAKAYDILRGYNGPNGYIEKLRYEVYAYKKTLNDFHINFILENHNLPSRFIGRNVRVMEWWGEKKKEELGLEFVPKIMEVGWYFGQASGLHVFYARFRRSQEKGILIICSSEALITNFWMEDFHELDVDLTKYNSEKRTVMTHQVEGVKFLTSRKKCILADEQGGCKTGTAILGALVGGYKHVLIICPQSVKKTWEYELSFYVNPEDVTIVSGSQWQDNKFTIINYDILDNFYEIPKQIIKKKEISLDEKGKVVTTYKEKEIKAKNKNIITKALGYSQLFQAKYDLIIIDEAHKLSNNTSGRFQIISDLVSRSNPDGIFELTGTMITNSSKNLYNLLKIIDVPVTRNWNRYMERYCGTKKYYDKKEKEAYLSIFLKKIGQKNLAEDKKAEFMEFLDKKKCKCFYVQGEDQNMDELKEIIKPYYLRRLKKDFSDMVTKTVKCIHYEMTQEERESYNGLWEKYLELQEDKEKTNKNKQLIEVSLMRQWLADKMIPKTVWLARKCVDLGHKVVIFCAYDNEIRKLREAFKDCCVYHNGKLSEAKKNQSVERFQNDDSVKVFIGNIQSASVGLTLIAGTVVIFNNFSFVPADNQQAQDRVWRIGQNKPCTIYYQSFNGTYFDKMLEIVNSKEDVIDKIITTEKEK